MTSFSTFSMIHTLPLNFHVLCDCYLHWCALKKKQPICIFLLLCLLQISPCFAKLLFPLMCIFLLRHFVVSLAKSCVAISTSNLISLCWIKLFLGSQWTDNKVMIRLVLNLLTFSQVAKISYFPVYQKLASALPQ